jgi:hypothetical protein
MSARPGLFPPPQKTGSPQIRKQKGKLHRNRSKNESVLSSGGGFKVRPSASDRRMMIENIAVTLSAVLIGSWKMDALIRKFNFP